MTKLIIQIPCYNEEKYLPITLAELPKQIDGIDIIEWLIIDDGSIDKTVEVAKNNGVQHIVRLIGHQGLAKAFIAGLNKAIQEEADIIVNTDADNQYSAQDIAKLINPILKGEAEIVIGSRPINDIEHFSFIKKILQKLGSWVVRKISNTNVIDAPSGFRAISRQAAMKLNVFSEYSYTLETIIQAGHKNIAITSVPIQTNKDLRPSRLFKSMSAYLRKSIITIIRIFIIYKPFRFFITISLILFIIGVLISLRFLWFYFTDSGSGHIQSLILSTLLIGSSISLFVVGILADIISVNRKLLEKIDWQLREIEEKLKKKEFDK